MKIPSSRAVAALGLAAFLGLYGCNEDDNAKPAAQTKAAETKGAAEWSTWRPQFADQSAPAQQAMAEAAGPAQQADSNAPAERIKEVANASFDGSKDQKALSRDQSDAVAVPETSGKKDVPYTAAPPKKELDDAAAAPPEPAPKDPQVAACERVLRAHDQDGSGCADHPDLSLEWAGIKDGFREQFGSVTAVASTLILTAVGMILTGGWAALAKVLNILLAGAAAWLLFKQIANLYRAVKALIFAPKGGDDYAEGIRQVASSATQIAIMAGAFKAGKAVGEAKAAAKQPGLLSRGWQAVRGLLPAPGHA